MTYACILCFTSGNIIINKNKNARGNPLCMNMIDCGLVVELGEVDHVTLVRILGAFIKRDGNQAGQLMVDTAKKCNANKLDVELFCKGMEDIVRADEEQVRMNSFSEFYFPIHASYLTRFLYIELPRECR